MTAPNIVAARIAALPGPFDIKRVVEYEGPFITPGHLFPDFTPESFAATSTFRDPRFYAADEHKLIMAFHGIVVRTPRSTILIDTCMGNQKHRPRNPLWHMRDGPFLADLTGIGLRPEQIDIVLCTHLHADHVGWNTMQRDGRWMPTFPNARYLFGRREVAHWQGVLASADPDAVNHGSWADSVQPIFDAGLAVVVDEDYEIEPGVRLVAAPGHTPGNVMVRLRHGDDVAFVTGDTIHHPVQIERPEWSSRFCHSAEQSAMTRIKLLEDLSDTGIWMIPAHFPFPAATRIVSAREGFRVTM